MFARHVTMKLRPDSVTKFVRVMGSGVLPLLREQDGFLDQVTLISPECVEAVVITFWDRKESEEAFNRTKNPEVLTRLLQVIEGNPGVRLFEVIPTISADVNADTEQEAKSERYDHEYQRA